MTRIIGEPFYRLEIPDNHRVVVEADGRDVSGMIAWCIDTWGPTGPATWGVETLRDAPPSNGLRMQDFAFWFTDPADAEMFQQRFAVREPA